MTKDEAREVVRKIVEAVVEGLLDAAGQYESGQRQPCSPQEALRMFALELEAAHQARDDAGMF